jgi:hypothetical protein
MSLQEAQARKFAVAVPAPVGGVLAGLVAGAAYLFAQTLFASLTHGLTPAPIQRIAAILMGPDIAPPNEWSVVVFGMALLIHFGLAMVFGRIVCTFTWGRPLRPALAIGAVVGLALFALDFLLIAPSAFPWFDASPRLVTAIDHALFGAVAAAVGVALHQRGA